MACSPEFDGFAVLEKSRRLWHQIFPQKTADTNVIFSQNQPKNLSKRIFRRTKYTLQYKTHCTEYCTTNLEAEGVRTRTFMRKCKYGSVSYKDPQ